METFNFGDWVIYDPGYKQEIGRVTIDLGKRAYVCYDMGCTAASTLKEHLRHATEKEIKTAPNGIGFHRFDSYCPIAESCSGIERCKAWRNIFIDKKGKENEDNEDKMQW